MYRVIGRRSSATSKSTLSPKSRCKYANDGGKRYTEPLGSGYLRKERLEIGDTLVSTGLPEVSLAVSALFPQAV